MSKLDRLVNACWSLDAQVDGNNLRLPDELRQPLAEFQEALWDVSPYFGIDALRLIQSRVEQVLSGRTTQ